MTKTLDPPQVYVVDPETLSVDSYLLWDDEQGIIALRMCYALWDEAEAVVTESKHTGLDTPFSVFAIQCESFVCTSFFGAATFASIRPPAPSIGNASDAGTLAKNIWSTPV